MNSLKRAMNYQFTETKRYILGFWSTIIIVNIIFLIINYLTMIDGSIDITIGFTLGNSQSIVGVNFLIIVIHFLIYNYQSKYESFPLSLSLGMTRKDYFISLLSNNIIMTLIFAVIQTLLLKIDPILVKMIGGNPVYDFILFNIKTDNILYIIFNVFIFFLTFVCFWSFLASVNYKLGHKMWIILLGLSMLVSILNIEVIANTIENFFILFGNILFTRYGAFEILAILISISLLYILNYFITINTDIMKKTI